MAKDGAAAGLPSHGFNSQVNTVEAVNGGLTSDASNDLRKASSGPRHTEGSPVSRTDSELGASPRMPGVPEDETDHSRVPGSQDPPYTALAPSPGTLSEGETESPNKSNLTVPSEQAGLVRNFSRHTTEGGPVVGELQLPPGSPLSEALDPPESPPDDEADHVLIPVARPTAELKNERGAGEDTAGNGSRGRTLARKPEGGVCGASLLDRGLFVQVREPPENYPVLKPCPGRGSPDRRGRQHDRSPRRRGGASQGNEFTTAEPLKDKKNDISRRLRGVSPCPAAATKEQEEDDEAAAAEKAKAKAKKRTWTYYPPPNGDEDAVPVDVIDHESEVLIVRREPPIQPRRQLAMSANVSHRSHGAAQPKATNQSKFVV